MLTVLGVFMALEKPECLANINYVPFFHVSWSNEGHSLFWQFLFFYLLKEWVSLSSSLGLLIVGSCATLLHREQKPQESNSEHFTILCKAATWLLWGKTFSGSFLLWLVIVKYWQLGFSPKRCNCSVLAFMHMLLSVYAAPLLSCVIMCVVCSARSNVPGEF